MHAWYVAPKIRAIFAPIMWTLTAGFGLAVRACLAVLVCSLCGLPLLPRLASPATLAVRADARDVISIHPSIYLHHMLHALCTIRLT